LLRRSAPRNDGENGKTLYEQDVAPRLSRSSYCCRFRICGFAGGGGHGANAQGISRGDLQNLHRQECEGHVARQAGDHAAVHAALRKAIDADSRRAAKRNEVPNLDGDPFVDAQDWDIKSFDISVQDKAPDKATGTVRFDNDGDRKTITLDLVKTADGWHIDEITTADGTLRKILSGK